MKLNKAQIQKSLRDLIVTSCQGGIPFEGDLSIEGLLGITVDGGTVVLVRISENITHEAPKDLSLVKREKRLLLEADTDHVAKRQRDANFRRTPHHMFGGGSEEYQNPFDESPSSGTTAPTSSLKLPVIHPELALGSNTQEAANSFLKQRHQEQLSRMLAMRAAKFPQMTSPERASMTTAAEQLQLQNKEVAQSVFQQMFEMNRLPQSLFAARLPIDMTGAKDKQESAGASPASLPTDLSLHHTSGRTESDLRHFNNRLSTSLGLSSSQAAPLAVVAGTGELQAVTSMHHGLRHDTNMLNMSATSGSESGDVQPVEIFPTDEGGLKLGEDKKMGQHLAKKDRVRLKIVA